VYFQNNERANLELVQHNADEMEADEHVHDYIHQLIFLDKHLFYEDKWLFQYLQHHHLLHKLYLVLDVLDKNVLMLLDLKHMMHHQHENQEVLCSKFIK